MKKQAIHDDEWAGTYHAEDEDHGAVITAFPELLGDRLIMDYNFIVRDDLTAARVNMDDPWAANGIWTLAEAAAAPNCDVEIGNVAFCAMVDVLQKAATEYDPQGE